MTRPLWRDDSLQKREARSISYRVGSIFKKLIPRLAFRPSHSRKSVLSQLRSRSVSVLIEWRNFDNNVLVEKILKLIKRELSLPNHFLVPADPLGILLDSGLDIDSAYFFLALRDELHVNFEDDEIKDWCARGITLGDFVRIVSSRTYPEYPESGRRDNE
jgi:hypothetical protein